MRFLRSRNRVLNIVPQIYDKLENDLKSPKMNLGQIQAYMNSQRSDIQKLSDAEFQVFSQWGDDGIIQYLLNKIDIPNKVFVEFGVENYKESNTRFLLMNNKWSGLVIDGSKANIDFIKNDKIYWGYDLHPTHAFITKDNINQLIQDFLNEGYPSEIGILSVDIDGNDYYVWKEINVVNPVLVIAEYNATFGPEKPWTIIYQEDFYRVTEDPTFQYWGVSLQALCLLAEDKGYSFIGCNSNGNNAYFLRNDKMGDFKSITSKEGFVEASFREYRNPQGDRIGGPKRLEMIRGRKIYNVQTKAVEII